MLKNHLNKISINQSKFISSVEGLGDILVFEASKKTNKVTVVKDGLRRIDSLIAKLFDIEEKDPKKFDALVLSEEFFSIQKKDKLEASWKMETNPDKYLPAFSVPINQIVRVFDKALEVGNDEISRNAVYSIIYALVRVSQNRGNSFLVKQMLRTLFNVSKKAVKKDDLSSYSAFEWYSDVVFNELNQSKRHLKLEYIQILNDYFRQSVFYLIDEGYKHIFKASIQNLVDGVLVYDQFDEVWTLAHLLLQQNGTLYLQIDEGKKVESLVAKLLDDKENIQTKDNLEKWKNALKILKDSVYEHLDNRNKKEANKIYKNLLRSARDRYLLNLLWEVLFTICVYSIYKKSPDFIYELWTSKQPDDASATHGGTDLYPTSLKEAVYFYFNSESLRDGFDIWDGHHGAEKYKEQYFLLLLMKYLSPLRPDVSLSGETETEQYTDIENFQLQFNDAHKLSGIKYLVESLLGSVEGFRGNPEIITKLNISDNPIKLIDNKLIPFLKHLITNADNKLADLKVSQNLNDEKLEKFRNQFIAKFHENAKVRNILNAFGLYDNKVSENYTGSIKLIGTNRIESREMFLKDWYIDYSSYSEHYADGFSASEDKSLLEEIKKKSKEVDFLEIEKIITSKNDYIVFVSSRFAFNTLEESKKFVPEWYPNSEQSEIPGFIGMYQGARFNIPIYQVVNEDKNLIVAVNKNKFGKLTQYSPLEQADDTSLLVDIFRFKIDDLATSETVLRQILDNPSESIKNIGTRTEQEKHLREKVVIKVHERQEIKFADDFEGYFSKT